ncbi:reprolysin-like metallopeptidase [Flavobacterium sp. RS13.1]|uniref:zinc-dependent metalloprotease n=1 Tax=Flavobacterium sp. RS13.1 TaxID=3400345 RepID=UPI003AAD0F4B
MKKQLLILLSIFFCITVHSQTNVIWEKVNSVSAKKTESLPGQEKLYYKLNENLLIQKIAASGKTSKNAVSEITVPNTEGVLERFVVWESSNFDPELQAQYPEIRAYSGTGLDDKTAKIHFSVAPIGVQTMVIRSGKASEFIEQNPENKSEYVLFRSKNKDTSKLLICKTKEATTKKTSDKTAKTTSNTKTLKTLRLALSCTGEYTAFFGGTKEGALAGMNATMTRVNAVFNKDLAVQLTIIPNNLDIIYTNASTDPYSNAPQGANGAWNLEVQQTLTTVIGNSGYDIGHLFGRSGGGGDAGCIGCVCDNPVSSSDDQAKGSAYTSPSDGIPQGDTFDIDFVAHEMGHQLGGTHTFSHEIEGTGTNVEPGSGSTIMGYAGVTNDYNIQNVSDDYFAYASILQIQNNLATKSCPVSSPINNNPPVVSAGSDYTIPFNTPFILTGTGSDPDGDTVTYCWEQNDSATTTSGSNSIAYPAKPDGSLFRSFPPNNSSIRYMPSLNTVLQNRLTTTWESVSSVARTLHFSLTGRDNAALTIPQTNTDNMIVTVNAAVGPFAVTSQNTNDIGWQKGSFQTINWDVKNTNTLPGSNNVNIKLSIDGGLTFPVILAADTPNDGSQTITVPSDIAATNCRLLIEPVANIYYALNASSFAIGYTSATTCDSYSFGSSFTIPFGSAFTTKTVNVPDTGIVSDVKVAVNVTHERFSDLEIQIISPLGTTVKLFDKNCGSTNSTLTLNYDDSGAELDCSKTTSQMIVPAEFLNAFKGQNPQGTWKFEVRDAVSGRFGTINSASVTICSQVFTLDDSEFESVDFALYPNPNNGNFTVKFECDPTKDVEILVHDVLGRNVYNENFGKGAYFDQNIQLKKSSAGLYLVTILNGSKKIIKKILVN